MPDVNVLVYAHRADEATARALCGLAQGSCRRRGAIQPERAGGGRLRAHRHEPPGLREPDASARGIAAAIEQLTSHPRCHVGLPGASHLDAVARLCRASGASGGSRPSQAPRQCGPSPSPRDAPRSPGTPTSPVSSHDGAHAGSILSWPHERTGVAGWRCRGLRGCPALARRLLGISHSRGAYDSPVAGADRWPGRVGRVRVPALIREAG